MSRQRGGLKTAQLLPEWSPAACVPQESVSSVLTDGLGAWAGCTLSRRHKTGRYTTGSCCHPKEPQQSEKWSNRKNLKKFLRSKCPVMPFLCCWNPLYVLSPHALFSCCRRSCISSGEPSQLHLASTVPMHSFSPGEPSQVACLPAAPLLSEVSRLEALRAAGKGCSEVCSAASGAEASRLRCERKDSAHHG